MVQAIEATMARKATFIREAFAFMGKPNAQHHFMGEQ